MTMPGLLCRCPGRQRSAVCHVSDSTHTLSKSVDVRSRQVSVVCDLELRPGPVLRGRPRTSVNETRTETGAAPVPKGFQERPWFTSHCCCYLACQYSEMARQARSSRVYAAPGLRAPDIVDR